jgi:hypothetical protein
LPDLELPNGRSARAFRLASEDELPAAAAELGLTGASACVVLVGGADGMSTEELERARPLVADALVPWAEQRRAVVVDGGTDAGVMALAGAARRAQGATFPLVGVVAARPAEEASLEPGHSHFLVVPGDEWGDEAPWLARLADVVGGSSRSVTVLVNGGELSWADVALGAARARPLVVVERSGRTADAIAAALRGETGDPRAAAVAVWGPVHTVDVEDGAGLVSLLDALLTKGS